MRVHEGGSLMSDGEMKNDVILMKFLCENVLCKLRLHVYVYQGLSVGV